jgi:16S rRNA (cytosine967-C5)-methyltransferase
MTGEPARRRSARGAGRPYRRPRPDAARRAAFDLLRAVDERDAYANLVLPALLRERGLDGRDAAFATELAYGSLRGRGTYDAVLAACVDRPLDAVDPPVLDLLRLGSHQLLSMRVPSHAAVSATVELARAVAGDGRASFVNAVLRKVDADDLAGWVARVAPDRAIDPVGHLSVSTSHPRWVVDAMRDRLGSLSATEQLLLADNVAPEVTLVARPGRSEVGQLLAAGALPGRWSPYAARWPGGDPATLDAVRSGAAGVQDEGSQLVAIALGSAELAGVDRRWLDLCAGPGGKAALLAGMAASRGAVLLACEPQGHRATLVDRTLGRTRAERGGAWVAVADGRAGPWRPGSFDRVLADVPCTGLGALRRRPEARWRRRPADIARLGPLQRALLESAIEAARPGGLVAYVTCSPHLAETEVVVGDVLRARDDVEVLDARPSFPGVPELGPGPYVQLWPHLHGTDAMFMALLRRSP